MLKDGVLVGVEKLQLREPTLTSSQTPKKPRPRPFFPAAQEAMPAETDPPGELMYMVMSCERYSTEREREDFKVHRSV